MGLVVQGNYVQNMSIQYVMMKVDFDWNLFRMLLERIFSLNLKALLQISISICKVKKRLS